MPQWNSSIKKAPTDLKDWAISCPQACGKKYQKRCTVTLCENSSFSEITNTLDTSSLGSISDCLWDLRMTKFYSTKSLTISTASTSCERRLPTLCPAWTITFITKKNLAQILGSKTWFTISKKLWMWPKSTAPTKRRKCWLNSCGVANLAVDVSQWWLWCPRKQFLCEKKSCSECKLTFHRHFRAFIKRHF